MPDPKTLRTLLARFADARIAHTQQSRPGTEEELRDLAYTLCVMTGTREVREALATADHMLARAELPAAPAAAEPSREDLPMAA
ncbi:DUF5133 domain-containing protein [Streptomyces sp. NPDC051561]|uniref:DUF5133 domain-containing protein n=1 Tax=Streptomyces sp. NPDC051561 TaxID=3365658 RepID=UPI00379F19FE